jgi:hypothetical protein
MWLAIAGAPAVAENCFDPLSDPMSQRPTDWKRLLDWVPQTSNSEIVELQRISDAHGSNINLDFYSFTFKKHPVRTLQEVFARTREHFEIYARGSSRDSSQYFGAYRTSTAPNPEEQQNAKLWASVNPIGALMTFVLASYQSVLVLKATGLGVVLEQGDVLTTCATDHDFIFTTARTQKDGWHPVSGNRGFGMRDNGDGTWTFYTMATDRRAPYVGGLLAEASAYGRNASHPFESKKPDPAEELYLKGEEFWRMFFDALKADLENQGMPFLRETINSRRYAYPLTGS